MKKITCLALTLSSFLFANAQTTIANENFDGTNFELPLGWDVFADENYIETSNYFSCSGEMNLYANIYVDEETYLTTPSYNNLNSGLSDGSLTISYNLKIMDFSLETPFVGDFGNIEILYSINNGTTWVNLGNVNSLNFTPSDACQLMTYTIPQGITSTSSNLKFKFDFTYNSGDWEFLLDDFKIVQQTSSATSNLNLANLKVYPNPVSDVLNIDYQENVSNLTVYDLSGKLVKSFSATGLNNTVNVSNLKSGIYLLKIETESKNASTIKFIKK